MPPLLDEELPEGQPCDPDEDRDYEDPSAGTHLICIDPRCARCRPTKDNLARAAGLRTYDTALPQEWLDGQCDGRAVRGTRRWLELYEQLRLGVVWCYDPPHTFGEPIALTDNARAILRRD